MFVNPVEKQHAGAFAELSRLYDEAPEAEKAVFLQKLRLERGEDFANDWLRSRR